MIFICGETFHSKIKVSSFAIHIFDTYKFKFRVDERLTKTVKYKEMIIGNKGEKKSKAQRVVIEILKPWPVMELFGCLSFLNVIGFTHKRKMF